MSRLDQLLVEWEQHRTRLLAIDKELKQFSKQAPVAEQEARAVLESIPGVGTVTVDVVVSELGDVRRFASAKKVVAYAGLAPGQRESAGRARGSNIDLGRAVSGGCADVFLPRRRSVHPVYLQRRHF